MARSKKTLWIIVGIAALALLIGVLLKKQESAPLSNDNGGETMSGELLVPKRKAPTEMGGSTSLTFETGRVNEDAPTAPATQTQEEAETEQAIDPVEAACRYDVEGGVGNPPEAWKDDYSHWDLVNWGADIQQVGAFQPRPSVYWVNQPTEEDRQRERELLKEVMEAQTNGALRRTPKKGYLRRVIGNGKEIAYAAPDYVERYDIILKELDAIQSRSMQKVHGVGYQGHGELTTGKLANGFMVVYYRRFRDGSLIRSVTLPSGETKKWVAGPRWTCLNSQGVWLNP